MLGGRYSHTIDAKNRVSIPSKLRKDITGENFVMVRGMARCIELYPVDQWNKVIMPRLEKLDPFNPNHARVKREYLSWVTEETLDSQARLLLPQNLLQYAGIQKNVLIIGSLEKIELWNPDTWNEYINQQPLSFEEVTETVMTHL